MNNILTIEKVCKEYVSQSESLQVLKDVSFTLSEGESLIITGESGSGKSTLLNIIGGLDTLTSGTLISCGYDVGNLPESRLTRYRKESLGFIFQFHYLLKDFTALENLMFPSIISGVNFKGAREKAEKFLEEVGLKDRGKHYPSQLSGGERQRIAIARSLVNSPDLILADEPTGNLDEKNSRMVEEILFRLVKDHNKTLIMVTHDSLLAHKGDYHFHLENGSVKAL